MDHSYLWTGSNTHWHCHIYAHMQKFSNIPNDKNAEKMLKTFTYQKRSLISSHQCDENLTHMPAHIQIVYWNLMSSLDEIWNSLPCMKGKEIPEQEAEHSKLVGGNFFFRREVSLYIYMYIYIYMCVCVCVCVCRRLITLQYCGGFCHTWISHGCTCVISKITYI